MVKKQLEQLKDNLSDITDIIFDRNQKKRTKMGKSTKARLKTYYKEI